jgi:PST family polysaccharide transporter
MDNRAAVEMFSSLIKNNAILAVQFGATALVPLLIIPQIVSAIGIEKYGHIAVATSMAGYAVVLVQYAFQLTGPPRILQADSESLDAGAFLSITRAKGVLMGGALVVLAVSAATIGPGDSITLVVWSCLPLAAALNSVWYLQARGYFVDVLICSLVGTAGALITCYGLVRRGGDLAPIWAAVAMCASPLMLGLLSLLAAMRRIPAGDWKGPSFLPIGSELRQGAMLFLSQFTATGYMLAGPILISGYHGAAAAGAYSVIERIVNPAITVCLLTHTAAYPRLAHLFTRSPPEYWRLLRVVLLVYLLLSALISVGLFILRVPVLAYFFGGTPPPDSGILLVGAMAYLTGGIFGPLLTGYLVVSGRGREVLPVTICLLLLIFGLGVPMTRALGAPGWMAAMALAQWMLGAYAWVRWKRVGSQ